ncbi:Poly (ADP-ribose) polymerase [Mactra antiquata]
MEMESSDGPNASQLKVIVKQGDITTEPADCIVNSSNEELDLSRGAVSQSLLKKGGKKLEQALDRLRNEMKEKRIVVSDAPNMKCKKIIHTVAADTINEWKNVVLSCLNAAEKHKLSCIAFPALGTRMRLKPTDIAPVMFNAVREFEKSGPKSLSEVRFVIYQESMVADFRKVLDTKSKDIGARPKRNQGTNRKTNKDVKKSVTANRNPDRVTFVFYSLNMAKIQEAIKKLNACIEKEITQQKFNDSIIKRMDPSHVAEAKNIAGQNKLKLQIDRTGGNLVMTGLTANVTDAAGRIHKLLRDIQACEHDKQAAELLSGIVQWFYIEITNVGQNLQPYDKEMNYRIETAFNNKDKNIKFKADDKMYIIDFTDMIEYPEKNKQDSISVIRRDLVKGSAYKMPESWGDFKGDMKVVVLPPANQEYKTLETSFIQSVGTGFIVTKIERIMNRTLWTQYQAKKDQLNSQNPKGTQNERKLWHGTAPEAVDNINAHGFNRSYCGKNATVHGDGVYFAVNARYSASHTYSRPDSAGIKRMYYCLVLTGEFTRGSGGMRVPPKKAGQNDTALYDSVVDNVNGPGMYIIFHDTQAYPEYLVHFKQQ